MSQAKSSISKLDGILMTVPVSEFLPVSQNFNWKMKTTPETCIHFSMFVCCGAKSEKQTNRY